MFYFDEDHMENGFNEPGGLESRKELLNGTAMLSSSVFNEDNYSNNSSNSNSSSDEGCCAVNGDEEDELLRFDDIDELRSPMPKTILTGTKENRHHKDKRVITIVDGVKEQQSNQRRYKNASPKQRHRKRRFHEYYKLADDHLGSGAYASVQTAISLATGEEYAVKLVDKHENGHTRSRIIREVETFKMCRNHPNIVQLIEWFEDDDYFYMVFEKMHGGPMLNHIQRKVCFTEQEASLVTRDIANALKFLHDRGIAHRDVKPENILCTSLYKVSPVKLCDLDLASKPVLQQKGSNCGAKRPTTLFPVQSEPDLASPVGSAEFMAPEVVDAFVGDSLKYDKRCDMWSLGVIIYIMLCGYPPFYGECDRENCGWDQGQSCPDCQDNLFHRIQAGQFDFPPEEWDNISDSAKDLIRHLLVRNVRLRYTADDVLQHEWVLNGAPRTLLQTASNLFRNDSARDIHQMNEHFNVLNRFTAVASRLSGARAEIVGHGIKEEDSSDQTTPVITPPQELSPPLSPSFSSPPPPSLMVNMGGSGALIYANPQTLKPANAPPVFTIG